MTQGVKATLQEEAFFSFKDTPSLERDPSKVGR